MQEYYRKQQTLLAHYRFHESMGSVVPSDVLVGIVPQAIHVRHPQFASDDEVADDAVSALSLDIDLVLGSNDLRQGSEQITGKNVNHDRPHDDGDWPSDEEPDVEAEAHRSSSGPFEYLHWYHNLRTIAPCSTSITTSFTRETKGSKMGCIPSTGGSMTHALVRYVGVDK